MFVSRVKKIFLPQVAKLRPEFTGDFQMVVDDERHSGGASNGQNFFGEPPHFVGRRVLGAQLNNVRAAVAELLRDEFGRATTQIRGVYKRVEAAVGERLHL